MGGSNNELQYLTHKLVARASAYSMAVNIERSYIIENNRNNNSANVTMNGELLEIVSNLAVMVKLNRVLSSSIGFPNKHGLFRSLVLSTMLYGCES